MRKKDLRLLIYIGIVQIGEFKNNLRIIPKPFKISLIEYMEDSCKT